MRPFSFRLTFLALALAATAMTRAADPAPSEFDLRASSLRPVTYEFTFGDLRWKTTGPLVGWTKNYRRNPIPYRIALAAVTYARPLTAPNADSIWRHVDFLGSVVWSSITRGPENHWGGVTTGFRYNYDLPRRYHTALYGSFQGGVGAIDSSGEKYAQETDLTFTYLAAIGVRTRLSDALSLQVQALGQHISNGWQTHPSEGVDCWGVSLGFAYRPARRR
jgi:hypothetical protein